MNILLFGGAGQVGWELQRALAPLGRIIAPSRQACDLTDPDSIRHTIADTSARVVVNAAAYTGVDQAESHAELARRVNALAPGVMAQACARSGAVLVHYSTDYVYDGSGDRPWRENDPPRPVNVYGQTKLEGDVAVQQAGIAFLILRTGWVYAARGRNFPRTILELACRQRTLKVVNDQVGSPTGADLIADVTAHTLRAVLRDPALGGLYHVAADGFADWHTVARCVLDHGRRCGFPVQAQPDDVQAIATADYRTAARRPLNSRLDTALLRETFGLCLPPWQAGIARLIETLA